MDGEIVIQDDTIEVFHRSKKLLLEQPYTFLLFWSSLPKWQGSGSHSITGRYITSLYSGGRASWFFI